MNTQERTDTRRQQAESRLLVIRNALTVADEELSRALAERDWEVFGLDSFEDYCAAMLPELAHIKLRAPARQARAKMLLQHGATERAIAAATGSSVGTAHNDVVYLTTGKKPGGVLKNEQEASPQRVQVATPPPSTNVARTVALVAAQGVRGLTYIELCREAGWRGGQATGALHEAKQRGLIVPSGRFRDGCTVYLRP